MVPWQAAVYHVMPAYVPKESHWDWHPVFWIPAFAGMTPQATGIQSLEIKEILIYVLPLI